MKPIFVFLFVIVLNLCSLAQYDLYSSKAWMRFIEKELAFNDTVIAIGTSFASYGYNKRDPFKQIVVLFPSEDGNWLAIKFYVGKVDTTFSDSYFISSNETFIRSNFSDLRDLIISNAGFKGINVSGSGAISFYMKVGDEVVYENYFHNGRLGIASYLETDLELFFLYYSIGNNTVP